MDLTSIDGGTIKSGQIIYDGKDMLTMDFEEKRRLKGKKISMVFQDPQSYLNPVIKSANKYLNHILSIIRKQQKKR